MKVQTETYARRDMVTVTCLRCKRQWSAPTDGEAGDGFSTCPRCEASVAVEVPDESGFRPGTPAPGITVLRGMPEDESAAFITDRYGARLICGWMCNGEWQPAIHQHTPYMTSAATKRLAELLTDLWQCDECLEWSRGGNTCGHCETARPDSGLQPPSPEAED